MTIKNTEKTDPYSKYYHSKAKALEHATARRGAVGRVIVKSELDAIEKLFKKVDFLESVVEIGVGSGVVGLRLLRNTHIQEFIGCDTSKEMLAISKENMKNCSYAKNRVNLLLADVAHLPLKDKCVDVTVSIRVISHFHSKQTAFKEIKRTLKANGSFIFDYYNSLSIITLSRMLDKRKGDFTQFESIKSDLMIANLRIKQTQSRFIIGHIMFEIFPQRMLSVLYLLDKAMSNIPFLRDFSARRFILAKIDRNGMCSRLIR